MTRKPAKHKVTIVAVADSGTGRQPAEAWSYLYPKRRDLFVQIEGKIILVRVPR